LVVVEINQSNSLFASWPPGFLALNARSAFALHLMLYPQGVALQKSSVSAKIGVVATPAGVVAVATYVCTHARDSTAARAEGKVGSTTSRSRTVDRICFCKFSRHDLHRSHAMYEEIKKKTKKNGTPQPRNRNDMRAHPSHCRLAVRNRALVLGGA